MKNDEINLNDQIICVLEYPEDGDVAVVTFVNYTALQTDKSVGCREYVKLIQKALKSSPGYTGAKTYKGSTDYAITFGNADAEKYAVTPPCTVHDSVTIFFS